MAKSSLTLAVIGAIAFVVATQSAFIVPETHQVLVLQFGEPMAKYTEPGLKFKVPFIQQIKTFDKRVLDVDPPAEEVILADKKRLVVDTFARYKIDDMLQFHKSLSTEAQANSRLNNIINSTMRSVLGSVELGAILSDKRTELMSEIQKRVNDSVSRFGTKIIDIRIVRADLPEQTSQAIYARMKTEREREAAEFRAQGQELAQEIRASADKERTVILAEAENQAQIVRGQGDAEAIKIYADAFNKDKDFYSFYRTMEAYRKSMKGDDTTIILSPDNEFLKYMKDEDGTLKK